jgi:phytoene dehydrogenase-like protein
LRGFSHYDAVVVGGGHNGLVCANYLAKENMKVLVLERRHLVGGAAVSEEVFPGYTFSRASYLLSLFRNVIIDDLFPPNWRDELKLYRREYPSFTPTSDGQYLLLGGGLDEKEIGKFSEKDARMMPIYTRNLEEIVDMINPIIDTAPPKSLSEWARLLFKLKLPQHQSLTQVYQMMLAPCATVLNQYFESDVLKATLASDGVIGAMGSPYSQGSSYILMHHVMGEIDGKNKWYYVRGGMGSLSEYLAKLARQRGVDIQLNAQVEEMIIGNTRRVEGIRLADGTVVRAPVVISNATHNVTFRNLIKEQGLIP